MSKQMMTVVMLAVAGVQPNPKNPRQSMDSQELRLLAEDIKRRGVLCPLLVRPLGSSHQVADGHRRLAAAQLAGLEQVPCVVLDANTTDAHVYELALVTQLHSQALTPFEVYTGAKHWLALHPEATGKHLAAAISRSEGYVCMILSLDRCIQSVKDGAAQAVVSMKDWYSMSQADAEQQAEMLRAKLNGAPAEGLKRLRNKPSNTVRTAKVPCAMPSGVVITIVSKGEGLTLAEIIEELALLSREAKRAEDQGLDSSTFSRVLKDKAAAKAS